METKASIVVMSHLSDSLVLMGDCGNRTAKRDIRFAQFIILETKGDLNMLIDADAMWNKFFENYQKT